MKEAASYYKLSVVIEPPAPWKSIPKRDFFTYNEVIKGICHVIVYEDIEVKEIKVILSGRSKIEGVIFSKTHDFLHDMMTVFPPRSTSAENVPLKKGDHQFQFSFKLPYTAYCGDELARMSSNRCTSMREMGNSGEVYSHKPHLRRASLPPSISFLDGYSSVRYAISVELNSLKYQSSSLEKEFRFNPIELARGSYTNLTAGTPILSETQLKVFKASGEKDLPIDIRSCIKMKRVLIAGRNGLDISFSATVAKKPKAPISLYIRSIQLKLVKIIRKGTGFDTHYPDLDETLISDQSTYEVLMRPVSTLASKVSGSEYQCEANISHIFGGKFDLNDPIPGFLTCGLSLRYQLHQKIKVSLSPDLPLKKCKALQGTCNVFVTGPVREERDPEPHYQYVDAWILRRLPEERHKMNKL
jgi:hypothetical protein